MLSMVMLFWKSGFQQLYCFQYVKMRSKGVKHCQPFLENWISTIIPNLVFENEIKFGSGSAWSNVSGN